MRGFFLAVLMMASVVASASAMHPFVSGSKAQIEAARKGKPFILMFWSLTCAYCPNELKMLAELQKKYPGLDVVLVATDAVEESQRVAEQLDRYGLDKAARWVFADAMQERLRFEIDRRWYGEVPRTYFYNSAHQREVKMGLVGQAFVEEWLDRAKQGRAKE